MKVYIYWNLHKKCWSIKALSGPDKGRVKYHATAWEIVAPVFKVSEAGRQRVIREQCKNVHAGVVGYLRGWLDLDRDQGSATYTYTYADEEAADTWERVTYNPYRWSSFVSYKNNEEPLPIASAARCKAEGRLVRAKIGMA